MPLLLAWTRGHKQIAPKKVSHARMHWHIRKERPGWTVRHRCSATAPDLPIGHAPVCGPQTLFILDSLVSTARNRWCNC